MSKYSNEFKLKVVKYCIEGHHGFKSTADYFNIPAKVTVQKWCRKYEEHGEKGLLKNFKTSYSGEFKQSVVEYKPCRTKPKGKSDKRSLKIEQQMRKYKAQESVKKNLN